MNKLDIIRRRYNYWPTTLVVQLEWSIRCVCLCVRKINLEHLERHLT